MATAVRQILDVIAHLDRALIVKKMRDARDRNSAAAGYRVEGQHGYNGRSVGLLVEISRLRRLGLTWRGIARNLNVRRVPTLRGGLWSHATVHKLYSRSVAA